MCTHIFYTRHDHEYVLNTYIYVCVCVRITSKRLLRAVCSGLYVGSGGSGGGVQYTGDEINIGVKRRIIIVQPTRAAAADGVNLKREPDEFRLGYYLRWNNFRICHRTAR